MLNTQSFIRDCAAIREQRPLVHNITNYVAMSLAANSLLAIGASPLMSFFEEEMSEIVGISSALAINIGCLDAAQISAMHTSARKAHELGKAWVLDPVGAGASKVRTQTALDLLSLYHPTVLRGNASEILCLAGQSIKSKGVDSTDKSADAVEAAKLLARRYGCVVSVSGETDYITDGTSVNTIRNGSPLMPMVSAMGCTATAVTAAFAAVNPDPMQAASNAMALMGISGQLAAGKCGGSGSLPVAFIDELCNFKPEEAIQLLRV